MTSSSATTKLLSTLRAPARWWVRSLQAAAVASLLKLNAAATASALGIALTRATGLTSGIAGTPLAIATGSPIWCWELYRAPRFR